MPDSVHLLGLAGSLRRKSYNRALLRAAKSLAPEYADFDIFDLTDMPFYNHDLEESPPEQVVKLRQAITEADGLVLASPEYNYNPTPITKNLIDWGSRPRGEAALKGKPVMLMGASTGMIATARAQVHIRSMLDLLDAPVLVPQVLVGRAADKFDDDGNLTDESAHSFLEKTLRSFAEQLVERKG